MGHVPAARTSGRLPRRALFGGFRRRDTLVLIEGLREQLAQTAESVDRLWREREELVTRLASERAELKRELERERAALAEREAEGRIQAARAVADAEEQAMRLRHEAAKRIGEAADGLEDLLRLREQLLGELRGVVGTYSSLLHRAEEQRLPAAPPEGGLADTLPLHAPAPGNLFARHVEIDVGPFADFAELSAFERSLARLPKVEDVHIRRFGEDRADIELTLSEETPLVHELTLHLPYRMNVTPEDDHRLTVEVLADTG